MEYGSIYTQGGATGSANQAVGATFSKVTVFNTVGEANGVGVNAGVDELSVESDGIYQAFANLSFEGTVDSRFEFAITVDDLPNDSKLRGNQDILANQTGTVLDTHVGINGHRRLQAGDRVSLYVKSTAAGKQITLKNGVLGLHKVGN